MFKNKLDIIITVLIFFIISVATPAFAEADKTVAATVNGTEILTHRVTEMANYLRFQFKLQGEEIQKEQFPNIMLQALNMLINQEILYQAALENGYSAKHAEVDKEIELLKKQTGGEENFLGSLKNRNMSLEDQRQEVIHQILWQEFQQKEFESKVSVTIEEAKAYYDSYPGFFSSKPLVSTEHILIKVASDAPEVAVVEALSKMDAVVKKLNAGESFEDLARKYSEGPSAVDGGSLGFIKPGQMDPNYEKVAFSLPVGQVSKVIRTKFGFHILKVIKRQVPVLTPFADVQDDILEHLKTAKTNQLVQDYLTQKKQTIKIEFPK